MKPNEAIALLLLKVYKLLPFGVNVILKVAFVDVLIPFANASKNFLFFLFFTIQTLTLPMLLTILYHTYNTNNTTTYTTYTTYVTYNTILTILTILILTPTIQKIFFFIINLKFYNTSYLHH